MQVIYKIEDKTIWQRALAAGIYHGAPIDLADGFIHFSTAAQARETAAKHFADRHGLIIAAIDVDQLAEKLKWEVSRGGARFPHLYDTLDMSAVLTTHDLPIGENGEHIFSEEIS